MALIHNRTSVAALCILGTLLFSNPFEAEEKRPFTIDDYSHWNSIVAPAISPDGEWVTFGYSKTKADDAFYIQATHSEKKYTFTGGSAPKFSENSQWAALTLALPWKEAEKLRSQKKTVPQKAVLVDLGTGEKTPFENIASYIFSPSSGHLAVKKSPADPKAEHSGTDLILINLKNAAQQNLGNVSEFMFNKSGSMLAYIVDAVEMAGNGLYLLDLEQSMQNVLDTGEAEYSQLTWDQKGTSLAALKATKTKEWKEKVNILLAFTQVGTKNQCRHVYDPSEDSSFSKGMVISERSATQRGSRSQRVSARGNLFWSEDLTRVFCGIKEQEKVPEKRQEDEDPPADVDIWHWQDETLQSVQKLQATQDQNFTYRSVYNLDTKRFFRLCDKRMRTIAITQDGRWGIGRDEKDYISDWEESRADYYRVDTRTGEKVLMFKAQKQTLGLSPNSQHFLYWKEGQIWDYEIASQKSLKLTTQAPVSFVNTEYDHPGTKPAYGVTGWSADGKYVILTHRYDLYLQPLNGGPAVNLTEGIGTKHKIHLRYIATDPEARCIDLKKPLLLSAFGEWTKQSGFYKLEQGRMDRLVYADKFFGRPLKAKKADRFFHTIETPQDFPDYYITDGSFQNPRRITEANPLKQEFKWGSNILIEYANQDGKKLQGVLMIPEDYSAGDKLPMLVDFYEKNSQNLFRFSRMIYRDTPMFYKYVSNGYLVLLPDVHFNTRTTHSDMLDCVEAAVTRVIELGYADPARIGLHGHSFSGQGGAFIATKSKLFAAIVAGAAATNLISDFNQLWKSSGTNQHRYDYYGQGRFGTNPFEDRELYIQESALFNAPTMNTPLLLLHGTADGSVEWLQAVEFYNALRFLGKNVILVSYPGQGHHATKLENKIDFQQRMEQFYDHYLKGKSAPDWMTQGVPYLKKKK